MVGNRHYSGIILAFLAACSANSPAERQSTEAPSELEPSKLAPESVPSDAVAPGAPAAAVNASGASAMAVNQNVNHTLAAIRPTLSVTNMKGVFGAARTALRSSTVRSNLDSALASATTTPFERSLIGLHPVATRIAELSQQEQRSVSEQAEYDSLVQQLRGSPAAMRLAELTRSSPMSCLQFEQAASTQWREAIGESPEFSNGVEVLRKHCASGATTIAGLWSGFAAPDWNSRIVLGDEELPRSEATGKILAGVGGALLIVGGVAVALLVPGAGPLIGGILISVGVAGVSYAATGEGLVGLQCSMDPDGAVSACKSTGGLTLAANGCLTNVNACTTTAQCGNASTFCTYGCCEAFSTGLAKQDSGLSTYALFVELPAGVLPNQVGVWGSRTVKINDRARVMKADGSGAPVVATTEGSVTNIGVDTLVGKVIASGSATLRDRAHVNGGLSVTGSVSYNNVNTVIVDGTRTIGAAAVPLQKPPIRMAWLTTFQDSGLTPVNLEPDHTVTLTPGNYGDVIVKARSHLVLQPGQYHFNSLNTDAGSFLDLPANLLTKVDIRNSLRLLGTVNQQGTAQTLMITFVGANATVNQKFAGCLVAPYANVYLSVAGADMRASVWGLSVELFEGGRVRLGDTSVWDLVTADAGG